MASGHKSGEYKPVDQEHGPRIAVLERMAEDHEVRIDAHDQRLALGDVGFAEVRGDIRGLTEKVGALITAAWWLIGVLALGVLGTAGGALLWVIAQMGNK